MQEANSCSGDETGVVSKATSTIVIPTLNERQHLAGALAAIVENGYPLTLLRVLIVDGGSRDGTLDVVNDYVAKWPGVFRLVILEGATVYQAVEYALEHADTEFFLRVDARSFIPPGYIARCIEHLRKPGIVGAGGVQKQVGTTPVGRAVALATSHPFGVGNASFRIGKISGYADTVYLGAYRTVDLKRVGGYDVVGRFLSEDASINAKLREAGGRIYLDAQLKVKYPAKETLRALAKQYMIYGAAKATYFLANRRLTAMRQVLPVLFLGSLIFTAVASLSYPPAIFLFIAELLMYLLPSIFVSARLANANRDVALHDLIRTFAVIHFAWPIGFLLRLIVGETPLSRLLAK
jgi:Glycosyltransferases, probably involved in cell wall biogenesis